MFFPRLRRHAKWMFVLLALAFGLGFVVFGVGAGGVGVGDIFRGSGGTGAQSVSRRARRDRGPPKDAEAWRDLATALRPRARPRRRSPRSTPPSARPEGRAAPTASSRASASTLASERQQDAQLAQATAVYRAPSQAFPALIGTAGQRHRAGSDRERGEQASRHGA